MSEVNRRMDAFVVKHGETGELRMLCRECDGKTPDVLLKSGPGPAQTPDDEGYFHCADCGKVLPFIG